MEFGHFLDGFRINVKSVIVVMVATVMLSQIASLLMPPELMSFQLTEEQSQDFELMMMAFEDLSQVLKANTGSFYLFVGLQIFLSIALMFAPYFASLNGKDGLESLADSIKLALPNFLKIFLAILLVTLIAIPVTVLTIGLGPFGDCTVHAVGGLRYLRPAHGRVKTNSFLRKDYQLLLRQKTGGPREGCIQTPPRCTLSRACFFYFSSSTQASLVRIKNKKPRSLSDQGFVCADERTRTFTR